MDAEQAAKMADRQHSSIVVRWKSRLMKNYLGLTKPNFELL